MFKGCLIVVARGSSRANFTHNNAPYHSNESEKKWENDGEKIAVSLMFIMACS